MSCHTVRARPYSDYHQDFFVQSGCAMFSAKVWLKSWPPYVTAVKNHLNIAPEERR